MITKSKKPARLSTKIALITCSALALIFLVLITVTVVKTASAIEQSSFRELQMLSSKNASDVNQVMQSAEMISDNLSRYMQDSESQRAQMQQQTVVEEGTQAARYRSRLYPEATFEAYGMATENYFISSLSSAISEDNGIVGCGVFFEPYIMSPELKSYSPYASKDGNVTAFSEYDTYSAEPYYKSVFDTKQTVYTDPYEFDGSKIVTVAVPMMVNNNLAAVVNTDVDLTRFNRIESTNAKYPSMYTAIIKDDGVIIYESSSLDYVGTNTFEYMSNPAAVSETQSGFASGKAFYTTSINSTQDKVYKFYDPIPAGNGYWYTMTAVNVADVNRTALVTALLLVGISVLALILILFVILTTLRKMLSPIGRVAGVAEQISQGNLDVHVDVESNDEIGMLATSFQQTVTSLKEMIFGLSHMLNEISVGNLSIEMNTDFKGDFSQIGDAMNRILLDLNQVLSRINISADEVAKGSEQVSQGAQTLSQGATEQASSVEELAATITEISQQVKNNADAAIEASEKTSLVGNQVEESNRQMQSLTMAMEEISNSSSEIGKIIKTIEDIAFQTNILALNAAVEAARAGAAGKGFAVVADEVRNLASKSAEAAKNTTALIEGSIRAVSSGTQIAGQTAQSLIAVVEGVREVSGIVGRISKESAQQAESIIQVTQGVDQISVVVQTNSATAEESAAASEELSSQANVMKGLVNHFKLRGEA